MAGIYIHIPLCKRKCNYCDFYSRTDISLKGAILGAILDELERRRDFLPDKQMNTIYVGGGTPSLLVPSEIGDLIKRVAQLWDCSTLREVTVEVNPDDVDQHWLHELRGQGVERLSIGVQSLVDRDLRCLGRRHGADKARQAVLAAQRAGLGNISIDLIYGIPGMTMEEWDDNLARAIDLGVQHISAYHLTIEEDTPLGRMAARGEFSQVGESESREQFDLLRERLAGAGYEHYEISNFAMPGYRSLHNSGYWLGEHYLGVGPSAHSYNGVQRSWSVADTELYLAGGDIYQTEELSAADKYNEHVMVSLRCSEGIDAGELRRRFGEEFAGHFERNATPLVRSGLLRHERGRYRIEGSNLLVSNSIIEALFFV